MAKGIPLMGRGPDGKAKMINVDENGNVKVQLSGNIASAYEVGTNSIRQKVINALEVLQPDAFQAEEVLFDTQVFTASSDWLVKTPPKGARGFMFSLYVSAIEGTLDTNNDGLILQAEGLIAGINALSIASTRANALWQYRTIIWYPGATTFTPLGESTVFPVPCVVPPTVRLRVVAHNLGGGKSVTAKVGLSWLT